MSDSDAKENFTVTECSFERYLLDIWGDGTGSMDYWLGVSRRPYPPFSSAGYGTPLVNSLNGIGLVLLVVTVLSYGYKKRNLFWCLFPFGLGNAIFGVIQWLKI